MTFPLLIISDAPTAGTGLARITRDLATRIYNCIGEVEVATLGYGGPYKSSLGFHQYTMDMQDWVIYNLPDVWQDFAGDRQGAVLTIWDASRLLWFARPENCTDERLRSFLAKPNFRRWGYFPMDATGPHDKLTMILKHTIEGYDRVLAYSKWAEKILLRTCPKLDSITNLPHGIDTSVFKPRNRAAARHGVGERIGAKKQNGSWLSVPDDSLMIGIVATNNPRKDFGLAIATVAEIAKERNVFLWIHTDVLEKHWSLPALLFDFGLNDAARNFITLKPMTDEQMSWMYSACDVTLGIGMSEGFGYPIFESLACGTPCVHGEGGGAPEHMPEEFIVLPDTHHLEGVYNCYRPIHSPQAWARRVRELYLVKHRVTGLPPDLDWNKLWPRWEAWLRAGVL